VKFTEDWMPQVKYSRYLKDPVVSDALGSVLAAVAAGDMTPEEAAASMDATMADL